MSTMKVVSFAIHKGGAGKTTTTVNLAAWLAAQRHGLQQRRVLLIDMEPQANATECFMDNSGRDHPCAWSKCFAPYSC